MALRTASNGQNALKIFTSLIQEKSLYLLDEPENSLSPQFQLDICTYLTASARLRAQFVIATHSPLLLALPHAKIYNLDESPAKERAWYELENPKIYYDF